nr:MAG TPA: hypothetical protein [Caudoviricetes sp.]
MEKTHKASKFGIYMSIRSVKKRKTKRIQIYFNRGKKRGF